VVWTDRREEGRVWGKGDSGASGFGMGGKVDMKQEEKSREERGEEREGG
jgi:hypothetical protein